jgi:hypothetical protein
LQNSRQLAFQNYITSSHGLRNILSDIMSDESLSIGSFNFFLSSRVRVYFSVMVQRITSKATVDSSDSDNGDTAIELVDEDEDSDASDSSSSSDGGELEGGLQVAEDVDKTIVSGKAKGKGNRKHKAGLGGVKQGESECLLRIYAPFSQPLPQRMLRLLETKWTVNLQLNLHSTSPCSQPRNAQKT